MRQPTAIHPRVCAHERTIRQLTARDETGEHPMKFLTLSQIKKHSPCPSAWHQTLKLFGKRKRLPVAVRACVAVADWVDFNWLAEHLLSAPARADYRRATAPARADYRRATATARADYRRATATAWADYQRATATAWGDYDRATATAWGDHDRATAPAR